MGKKDNNDIYENDELFQDGNLLGHTSSNVVITREDEVGRLEKNNQCQNFEKSCIKIINGQNKYLQKLEKDIEEANKYILYCKDKISRIYPWCQDNETRTYYHSQIEKTEGIIEEKKYKINQTLKRISEMENKINRYK